MTNDKWPEVVAEFDRIEADIKRAMVRLKAYRNLMRLEAYRNRIAAKVEEDGKCK